MSNYFKRKLRGFFDWWTRRRVQVQVTTIGAGKVAYRGPVEHVEISGKVIDKIERKIVETGSSLAVTSPVHWFDAMLDNYLNSSPKGEILEGLLIECGDGKKRIMWAKKEI